MYESNSRRQHKSSAARYSARSKSVIAMHTGKRLLLYLSSRFGRSLRSIQRSEPCLALVGLLRSEVVSAVVCARFGLDNEVARVCHPKANIKQLDRFYREDVSVG